MRKAVDWFGTKQSALAWLWALFIVPRLALVLLDVEPTSDAAWYYSRAEKLAAGLGYLGDHGAPTAYWPPGWPMALSVPFSLFGASPLVVGLFNLGTAMLGGWLLLDLARRVGGSELAARTALLLFVVYPNAIAYVPLALTEVFYTTLLLAILAQTSSGLRQVRRADRARRAGGCAADNPQPPRAGPLGRGFDKWWGDAVCQQ